MSQSPMRSEQGIRSSPVAFREEHSVLRRVSLAVVVGIMLGVGVGGCGHDAMSPAFDPLTQQFWAARLNHHAITMALTPPYNTLQLTVTPLTLTGAPLGTNGTVVYTSSDTTVQVSPTGVLTAIGLTTSPTQVVANVTV